MKCNIFITFLTRYLLIEYKNLSAVTEPTASKMIVSKFTMVSTTVAGSFAHHNLGNYEQCYASVDLFIMIYMILVRTNPYNVYYSNDPNTLEY